IDPSLSELAAQLTSISYELEDAIETLRSVSGRFDFDDFRLEEVEGRLTQLKQLNRKYGGTLEEVLDFGRQAEREYDQYLHAEENVIALEAELHDLSVRWNQISGRLTQVRREAAQRFEQAVLAQLKDLGMEDARFEARLIPRPLEEGQRGLPASGAERVQFYLAANRGEDPAPLDKVASGGELSRIMLAIKAVVAAMDDIPTMIFDEIDSGISGNMARIVGQKLALIARQRQVVCITHTAQIAAMADAHYYIEKVAGESRTHTQVSALAPGDRYREIARLVGGDMAGSVAAEHAREMLKWCRQYKKSL
ncbi:MAG: DNA repair protein RecN, partial [Christensenellaceae bacterium]